MSHARTYGAKGINPCNWGLKMKKISVCAHVWCGKDKRSKEYTQLGVRNNLNIVLCLSLSLSYSLFSWVSSYYLLRPGDPSCVFLFLLSLSMDSLVESGWQVYTMLLSKCAYACICLVRLILVCGVVHRIGLLWPLRACCFRSGSISNVISTLLLFFELDLIFFCKSMIITL